MTAGSTLYADSLVEISSDAICFKSYYFPFGGERRVPFAEIESIAAQEPHLLTGQWLLWGSGDFVTWFPRDLERPHRTVLFFASLRDTAHRIGFSVEDAPQVEQILRDKGLLQTP